MRRLGFNRFRRSGTRERHNLRSSSWHGSLDQIHRELVAVVPHVERHDIAWHDRTRPDETIYHVFPTVHGGRGRGSIFVTRFGIEFDSLADVVSFGVAPAVIVHSLRLPFLGPWNWLLGAVFLLTAAFRLARFNLTATREERSGQSQDLSTRMDERTSSGDSTRASKSVPSGLISSSK